MAAMQRRSAADLDLKIQRLNHFTLPVRDHEVARRFYCDILGAKVVHDVDWSGVKAGRNRSTALGVKLFEAPGVLDLFYQPFGQPPTDASHPHFAFMVDTPEELDRFKERLQLFDVPVVGPLTRRSRESLQPGDLVPVELYFNDPDGNHLELNCSNYPYTEGMHVGPYDRWELLYSWRDWKRAHGESEQSAPPDPAPRIPGFSHFTLPVRDLDKAELFYTQVLGADFVHRSEPDRVQKGLAHALQVLVKLCEGIDISLFQQPGGWLPVDGSHPHQAFDVPPQDLERWMTHLEAWDVPFKLVCRQRERPAVGSPCKVELYFFDPDGNHLELDAQDFPANETMHMGTYDHFPLAYPHNRWPSGTETSAH